MPAMRILKNVPLNLWFSGGRLIFDSVDIRVSGNLGIPNKTKAKAGKE